MQCTAEVNTVTVLQLRALPVQAIRETREVAGIGTCIKPTKQRRKTLLL